MSLCSSVDTMELTLERSNLFDFNEANELILDNNSHDWSYWGNTEWDYLELSLCCGNRGYKCVARAL